MKGFTVSRPLLVSVFLILGVEPVLGSHANEYTTSTQICPQNTAVQGWYWDGSYWDSRDAFMVTCEAGEPILGESPDLFAACFIDSFPCDVQDATGTCRKKLHGLGQRTPNGWFRLVAWQNYENRLSDGRYWENFRGTRLSFVPICAAEFYIEIDDPSAESGVGSCEAGQHALEGNPVNPANGNKVQSETDYLGTEAYPLSLIRHYNSNSVQRGAFGQKWQSPEPASLALSYQPQKSLRSSEFAHRSDACEQGWAQISADQPIYAGTSATLSATESCEIYRDGSLVLELPIYNAVTTPEPSAEPIKAVMTREDGRALTFERVAGNWVAQGASKSVLAETASGYQVQEGAIVQEFDPQGRLQRKHFPDGDTHQFAYGSDGRLAEVSNVAGRRLSYSYTPDGLVARVDGPDGWFAKYSHDALGNLVTVRYADDTPENAADNPTRQYLYEDARFPSRLTGIIDELGMRYATWAYDEFGRVVLSHHGAGADRVEFTYAADGSTTVRRWVTDPLAAEPVYAQRTLNFARAGGAQRLSGVDGDACVDCGHERTYRYDSAGFLDEVLDLNGVLRDLDYDDQGRLLQRRRAVGESQEVTESFTWDAATGRIASHQKAGRLMQYQYDAVGNLVQESVQSTDGAESRITRYDYYPSAACAQDLSGNARQLCRIDGPRDDVGDLTWFGYDGAGNRAVIRNALGHETRVVSFSEAGRPLEVIDANGVAKTFEYDVAGRLVAMVDPGGRTQFVYDAAGQLIETHSPDGVALHYEYDAARRLNAVEDANGNRIEFELDQMGNIVSREVKGAAGAVTQSLIQVFDQLGRLKQVNDAEGQSTRYAYDAMGNVTQTTEADTYATSQVYDALERLTQVTDAANGTTQYEYDALDNLTSVTDPTGVKTSYTYNAFGEVLTETSPNRGTLSYRYDEAGNRTSMTDDRGITAHYHYDVLNRLTAIDYPGTEEDVSYVYDGGNYSGVVPYGIGRLTGISDESGTMELRYDSRGNLIERIQTVLGQSYSTHYRYNSAGRLTGLTYPSGMVVDYDLDSLGQIARISVQIDDQAQTLASQIGYLPFGPMKALRYGNGSQWDASHDASYRLTESRISGAYEKHYGYDDRDLITAVDDALDAGQSQTFGYDALARLTDADQPSAQQDFSYDGVGNRLSKIESSSAESYSYQPATQKLDAISGSRSTTFSYDAIGNITAYDGKLLSYNQAGRLAQISDNGSALYSNRYSADGHRVIKADETGSTVFLYGPDGQLIAEHRQDGTPIREYIYLNGKLVGLTSKRNVELPSGDLNEGPVGGLLGGTTGALPNSPVSPEWELFYVVTDHLGSPRLVQDHDQQTVWQARYQPFGEVGISTELVTMPLRFPGQYHDAESGIYQNWWRDYEPTLGRYLQSDPIGLAGGLNGYGYAEGNPMSLIDPEGLRGVRPPRPPGQGTREIFNPNTPFRTQSQQQINAALLAARLRPPSDRQILNEALAKFIKDGDSFMQLVERQKEIRKCSLPRRVPDHAVPQIGPLPR